MSSMLEQAIIDATALREAAIKSAEQVVVNQYSEQIKNTVEQLLEQDAPPAEEDTASPEYAGTEYKTDKDEEYSKSLDSQIPLSLNEMLPDIEISDDAVLEIELADLDYENDEVAPGISCP